MKGMRALLLAVSVCVTAIASGRENDTVSMRLETDKPGATISRQLFGQFAEHLGRGIYEGVWVGPDSTIPNTRGIRTSSHSRAGGGEEES